MLIMKDLKKQFEKNVIDYDDNMYVRLDSLTKINNIFDIFTGSNNINLTKVDGKPYGFDKIAMDKDLIKGKFYQSIDHCNEKKTTPIKFYSIHLNKIRSLHYIILLYYQLMMTKKSNLLIGLKRKKLTMQNESLLQ